MRPRSLASPRSPGPSRAVPGACVDAATFRARLEELEDRATAAIVSADTPDALEAVASGVLGRKGELRDLLGLIGSLPAEERPLVGGAREPRTRTDRERDRGTARVARGHASSKHASRPRPRTSRSRVDSAGAAASTRSARQSARSRRIFGQFGFVSVESPEVETDELNFQALNIPDDHPARDLWDTIYVRPPTTAGDGSDGPRYLLRTHTSPGQIRAMRDSSPPIRILTPGRLLPLRGRRREPRLRVLPGRRADGRRGDEHGAPARPPRRVRPRDVRGDPRHPLPTWLLPVHGAVGRVRHRLRRL